MLWISGLAEGLLNSPEGLCYMVLVNHSFYAWSVYMFSRQFVTHFVLRFVEYKNACQLPKCRTSKRGRRALFVILLSVFKLPVAEAFYIARCYITIDKLLQDVYIYVTVMSKTVTYGGRGGGGISCWKQLRHLGESYISQWQRRNFSTLTTHDCPEPFPQWCSSFLEVWTSVCVSKMQIGNGVECTLICR